MSDFSAYDEPGSSSGADTRGVLAAGEAGRVRGGLRGSRISQVLSEARASLIDPSRPFTPASLDERAQNSLDGALSRALEREMSRTSSAASTSSSSNSRRGSAATADIWVNDAFDQGGDSAYLTMNELPGGGAGDGGGYGQQTEFSGHSGGGGGGGASSMHNMLAQNLRSSLSLNNSSREARRDGSSSQNVFQGLTGTTSSSSSATGGGYGGGGNDEWGGDDLLSGFNSGGYGSAPSGDERPSEDEGAGTLSMMFLDLSDAAAVLEAQLSGSSGDATQLQVLTGMTQPVDRLAKYIRRPALAQMAGGTADEVENLRKSLTRVLLRVIQINPTSKELTASRGARELACRHLLRMYVAHLQRGSIKSSSARMGKGGHSGSDRDMDRNRDVKTRRTTSSDTLRGVLRVTRTIYEMSNGSASTGISSDGAAMLTMGADGAGSTESTAMLEGGLQLLLDLLTHTWDTLQVEVSTLSGSAAALPASGVTSHPLSLLLEASVFAGGVLRWYSNEATNRKRLQHVGAVEALARGFKIACNVAQAVKISCSNNNSSGGGGSSSGTGTVGALYHHLTEQLGRVTEQLVGAQRNFIQDSSGRSRTLKVQSVGSLCALLVPFGGPGHAELVLNVARITAKLSLLDTFRTQINGKPEYVKSLVELVIREADKCRNVMEGGGSSSSQETETWPQWHTWPLLSRVSFTLGNLTTSNDQNRALIGVSCACIKHLVVLLQACACSLTELYKAEDSIDGDEEEEEKEESPTKPKQQSDGDRTPDHSFEAEDGDGEEEDGESGLKSPDNNKDDLDNPQVVAASGANNTSAAVQELTDATVKLLRLLANLCIDTDVGAAVAARMDACEMLNELLVCCNGHNAEDRGGQHEELLLNVVATCTNITYYACHKQAASAPSEAMPKRQQSALLAMSTHLSQCLFHSNSEVVLETARALGNLTRLPAVLTSLAQTRTDEALILLLSYKDMEVVSAVTGALINLSASPHSRPLLMQDGRAASALVSALRRSSLRNLPTSTLICQAFHNLIAATRAAQAAGEEGSNSSEAAMHPAGLQETLEELVDLAAELSETSDQYASFVNVGRAVQNLLNQAS